MDRIERNRTISATVALLLAAAVAMPAWAADPAEGEPEDQAPAFTSVSGTIVADSYSEEDWAEIWTDGPVVRVRGWRIEREIDWSDPRLPREMVSLLDVDTHLSESEAIQVMAETYRLEGPDGAWTGTGRALGLEHGQEPVWLIVLAGQGAYEGLSAMLTREIVRADSNRDELDQILVKGVIVEGELPA